MSGWFGGSEMTAKEWETLYKFTTVMQRDHFTKLISDLASEEKRGADLMEAYQEYIKLLCAELDEIIPMVHVHGWRSKRYEAGEACRAKIAALGGK
jgi:hypothetical protein